MGGSFRYFPSIPLGWWSLAIAGIVLQFLPLTGDVGFWALVASFALLLAFALLNLRAPGFILIFTGLLLNAIVIVANHGMPVAREALVRSGQESTLSDLQENGGSKHHLADDDTVLLVLGDSIVVPPPVGIAHQRGRPLRLPGSGVVLRRVAPAARTGPGQELTRRSDRLIRTLTLVAGPADS